MALTNVSPGVLLIKGVSLGFSPKVLTVNWAFNFLLEKPSP